MPKLSLSYLIAALFLAHSAFAGVAPELEALGLRPEIVKRVDKRFKNLSYEEDRYFLEVKLGKITRSQYDGLMGLYGNRSQVSYDANRAYDLLDFLPPFVQATANQIFEPKYYSLSEELREKWQREEMESADRWAFLKNGVSSFTNCWNTTLETLRSVHPRGGDTLFLYWPGRWTVSDQVYDDKFLRRIPDRDAGFGDVLLVSLVGGSSPETEYKMLQHSAFVLTSGLVFERTDSSENDPYRISFRADVEKKYRTLFKAEKFEIEYRRMVGSDFLAPPAYLTYEDRESWKAGDEDLLRKDLPAVNINRLASGCESGLGGGCDVVMSEVHEAKVVTNPKTGRGILYAPRRVLDRFSPLRAN